MWTGRPQTATSTFFTDGGRPCPLAIRLSLISKAKHTLALKLLGGFEPVFVAKEEAMNNEVTGKLKPILTALALCMAVSSAAAAPVIDQQAINLDISGFSGTGWQQSVTVGMTGQLVGLEIYVSGASSGTVKLFSGGAWQGGAALGSDTVTSAAGGWTYIDLTAENLYFTVGDVFSFAPSVSTGLTGSNSNAGAYAGGLAVFNSGSNLFYTSGEYDLAFRTYVEAAGAIPEPGGIALVGLGLGCLAFARKRKQ